MAVAESWEKSGRTASRTRVSHLKTWKSTRPLFKGLSEFGLCHRTATKVQAHLQPLARHGTPLCKVDFKRITNPIEPSERLWTRRISPPASSRACWHRRWSWGGVSRRRARRICRLLAPTCWGSTSCQSASPIRSEHRPLYSTKTQTPSTGPAPPSGTGEIPVPLAAKSTMPDHGHPHREPFDPRDECTPNNTKQWTIMC